MFREGAPEPLHVLDHLSDRIKPATVNKLLIRYQKVKTVTFNRITLFKR